MSSLDVFLRMLKYLRGYYGRLAAALICAAGVAGTAAAYAWLMQPVLDDLFIAKDQSLLILLPLLIMAVALCKGLFGYGQAYLMSYVGHQLIAGVRQQLFGHFLRLPVPFHHDHTSGRLLARVTNDVNLLGNAIPSVVKDIFQQGLTFVAMLGVAFYQNWKLATMVLLVFPISAYAIVKIGKRIRKFATRGQESMGDMASLVSEALKGIRIVKAYRAEETEQNRFSKSNAAFMRANIKSAQVAAVTSPLLEVIGVGGIAVIIWYGGFLVIDNQMKPGEFFSFLFALAMAYGPVRKLAAVNMTLQSALAAGYRIFDMLDRQNEYEQDKGHITLPRVPHALEFQNVSFSYPDSQKLALVKMNLTIEAGEIVALVGRSGSGKSTLISLVSRFYHPTDGVITIDGQDIQQVKLGSLRSQIALVSQDIVLFDETIRANIAYGAIDVHDQAVVEAARAAHAWEFIGQLPQGLDTLIGENGVKLSGGQRQRLAIARAILHDPPLLILDEATSALDTESERMVQAALAILMKNRTTLVIAHRLSTVQHANRIVVLNEGRLVETGTHTELLQQNGSYKRLYQTQFYDMPVETHT
ncbi:MAG: lipid A export permease/ATP-binding protein MsbA [Nitrospirota bacterium]|nr:lipid A export permease/ATP-binding protein MsbA [Nitrospirota bacterium]